MNWQSGIAINDRPSSMAAHCLDNIEIRSGSSTGEVSRGSAISSAIRTSICWYWGRAGGAASQNFSWVQLQKKIFHCVSCPVLTVGPWSRAAARQLELKRVLFATDLSPESFYRHFLCSGRGKDMAADIDVLHVCSPVTSECRGFEWKVYSRKMDAVTRGEPRSLRPLSPEPGSLRPPF